MENLKDDVLFARDAEQSIVAVLFSERETASEAFDRLSITLTADHFYFAQFKAVYEAYAALVERGAQPDPVVLATYLKSLPSFDESMRETITEAVSAPFAMENIEAYGAAVIEKANARRLKLELAAVQKKIARVGGDLSSKDLLREVDAISMNFEAREDENQLLQEPSEILRKTVERLEAMQSGSITGAKTGITTLDERLGPLVAGQFIVIAGRPSMGKTAFGLEIVVENNIRGVPEEEESDITAVFSLEMGSEQLGFRFLSNIGSIDHDNLRKSKLTEEDWSKLTYAFARYEKSNIHVDCDATLSPAVMRSKLRLLQRKTKKKLKLIVVDYLQLMEVDPGKKYANRNEEITAISRNMKKIAKEFNCPVIALSQLNRGVEQRSDKRPMMSDLRESGAIEQDADIIMLLYRDEYYNPDSDARGIAEIIVAKARDGGVGMVASEFIGHHQRFTNLKNGSYSYEAKYGEK